MRTNRLLGRRLLTGPAAAASVAFSAIIVAGSGCATLHRETSSFGENWGRGVEIRVPSNNALIMSSEREVAVYKASHLDRDEAAVPMEGYLERNDMTYDLQPGHYGFQYSPGRIAPVWGDIDIYPLTTPRARDFLRHTSVNLTPGPDGQRSVLTQADIDRARSGDVVTKVVAVVDLAAIRDRLDKIDRAMRELRRVRGILEDQENYWARKYSDRRLNTRYSAEFGWGVDVPSADLALMQTIFGPERYHWHRFSEADDQLRTHQEMLAQLDLPVRRLSEEQAALQQIMNSVTVIHRSDDLIVFSDNMVRPYGDPVHDIHQNRGGEVWTDYYRGKILWEGDDWVGGLGKPMLPYMYSSMANGFLSPGFRKLLTPSPAHTKNIGQAMMVVQVGSRRPPALRANVVATSSTMEQVN